MQALSRNQIIILVLVILLACGFVAVSILAMTGVILITRPRHTATPTITNTSSPTATEVSDAWMRIKESGKIVVGTSADYPPFSYYTEDFSYDGFDIALINAIASRLGLTVEFKDIAFDGLSAALQLEQVDVAIAAISVTPERESLLDFSSIYFISQDGALVRKDAQLGKIDSVDGLAPYRLGVQRGSVYEDWLRSSLVDTGKMTDDNLIAYQLMEQALGDLSDGQIELVVLDLLPAEEFAEGGEFKVAAKSLNRQRYAIAVNKEEETLLNEINRALGQLQDEGIVAALIEDYLNIKHDQVPTPEPTQIPQEPTPTPVIERCVDGMEFVVDLTLQDNNMTSPPVVPPGALLKKGWRIRNIGTCAWDNTYILQYAGGNSPFSSMSGQPMPIQGVVSPSAEFDLFIDLIAPPVAGVYQGFWQLFDNLNTPFGQKLSVGVQVPGNAPIPPTQTPSPGIVFSADPTQIRGGEAVNFYWNVSNAKSVFFNKQGEAWQNNPVSLVGSRLVYPLDTTIYELRVIQLNDSVDTRQIIIYATNPITDIRILQFSVQPPGPIRIGQCVDITWIVEGTLNQVNLKKNTEFLWQNAPASGAFQDCPSSPGEVTYEIVAHGPGGAVRDQQTVKVRDISIQ